MGSFIPPNKSLGVGQSWQDVSASRFSGVTYTNGKAWPIMVSVGASNATGDCGVWIEVSADGVSWITVGYDTNGINLNESNATAVVPSGHYYRVTEYGGSRQFWAELR